MVHGRVISIVLRCDINALLISPSDGVNIPTPTPPHFMAEGLKPPIEMIFSPFSTEWGKGLGDRG
jgi:hypothetical protein